MITLFTGNPGGKMRMLGALVQTEALLISHELVHQIIKKKTKQLFAEMNLRTFELGSGAVKAIS
jgi:Pyruvate/2-oxoacid:ferredoxin oxidoreductase gamma subunit